MLFPRFFYAPDGGGGAAPAGGESPSGTPTPAPVSGTPDVSTTPVKMDWDEAERRAAESIEKLQKAEAEPSNVVPIKKPEAGVKSGVVPPVADKPPVAPAPPAKPGTIEIDGKQVALEDVKAALQKRDQWKNHWQGHFDRQLATEKQQIQYQAQQILATERASMQANVQQMVQEVMRSQGLQARPGQQPGQPGATPYAGDPNADVSQRYDLSDPNQLFAALKETVNATLSESVEKHVKAAISPQLQAMAYEADTAFEMAFNDANARKESAYFIDEAKKAGIKFTADNRLDFDRTPAHEVQAFIKGMQQQTTAEGQYKEHLRTVISTAVKPYGAEFDLRLKMDLLNAFDVYRQQGRPVDDALAQELAKEIYDADQQRTAAQVALALARRKASLGAEQVIPASNEPPAPKKERGKMTWDEAQAQAEEQARRELGMR